MDEVENPDLPAAGESSPTLRPVDEDEDAGVRPNAAHKLEGDNAANNSTPNPPATRAAVPARPGLTRENSAPPPQQPPPAPPVQSVATESIDFSQEAPDSLTLADLKRIRSTFPQSQPTPKQQLADDEKVYDFDYRDSQSFPVELEEWFSYSEDEELKLRKCRSVFNDEWRSSEDGKHDWLDITEDARRAFVKKWMKVLEDGSEEEQATKALMILTYIGLGIWEETAGRREGCALEDLFSDSTFGGSRLDEYGSSSLQVQWIVAMVDTLHSCDGLRTIYSTLRKICERDFQSTVPEAPSRNETQARRGDESVELWCCLTLMYLFVEVARSTGNGQALKGDVLALEPSFLNYITQIVARLRWDESSPVPLTKMLLLAWKTILASFGGIQDVEKVKASFRENPDEMDARGQPIITASPLDYHLFRQEINSKYPAYQPPPPLFPLEPENNSILPPLKHRRPSFAMSDSAFTGAPSVGTASIMHQPVHIATPAPSPPPSPAGPGKAGKKQNYQTNQMFPFLYPPLDASSNELGGKGSTELQDALVGRKWQGADIPASILEAAELFATRMRATRGMKQLWEARVDFMKQERGWKNPDEDDLLPVDDDFELVPKAKPEDTVEQGQPVPLTDEQRQLNKVSQYYRDSLPHLQSVVIVLLKAVLQNVTDLVTKGNGQNGLQAGIQFNDVNGINGSKPLENGLNGHSDGIENTAEELDKLRTQEIAAKALSAILLLLLKWFKVTHILQYEYMTQLLLDSNYVPLILKLWQTQEIGRACHYKLDRSDRNFFAFCKSTSRQADPEPTTSISPNGVPTSDSEDDAAPPPIKRNRDADPDTILSPVFEDSEFAHPPEIDELGYAQTPLPTSLLKNYSYRNMFSAINYLRVLQKVTRRKTHRALLLVSYKSSNHLKKTLKIPVQQLRFYTLKLFKSQVPFCGRKWRQGNMKIITAVWLSVPAELRDDWLSGGGGGMGGACVGDVDGTVEDALPLEQSLRALTHWWNVRNFTDVMGVDKGMLEEEMDYFSRELEKMEISREEELGDEQALAEEGWQGPIEGY
ncbi:unnamed protein product [Zymoseptoria tritici ST99CH_3D7]|uniref:Far11/STRP C-terminal domain-containing protein n=1 Tax=Zymoseptoria tritici (strain ST99CH_3D7) TaxID=1276538 RepID=A0A1X7RLF9_ZYMT9|nr:unnamed protein product [Zymoseptoria tritici ST99CH_3D7]